MRVIHLVVPFPLVFLADNSRAFVDLTFRRKLCGVTTAAAAMGDVTKESQPQQPSGRQQTQGMRTSMKGSLRGGGIEDPGSDVPRLVVMDLDYTLWRPELYQMSGSPYTKGKDGKVRDRSGTVIELFPHVREILLEVHRGDRFRGSKLAVASRASQQTWARDVMNLIELEPGLPMRSVFSSTQVYSGSKVRHFGAIRKDTGIPYEDMIFFDDWDQNCIEVGGLGVTCIECPRGLNRQIWTRGLETFAADKKNKKTKTKSVRLRP